MANLKNKNFGNKVYLSDLRPEIVAEMLKESKKYDSNKVPNYGYLMRNNDRTVGVLLHWYDIRGYIHNSKELTNNTTIKSWAESHD